MASSPEHLWRDVTHPESYSFLQLLLCLPSFLNSRQVATYRWVCIRINDHIKLQLSVWRVSFVQLSERELALRSRAAGSSVNIPPLATAIVELCSFLKAPLAG